MLCTVTAITYLHSDVFSPEQIKVTLRWAGDEVALRCPELLYTFAFAMCSRYGIRFFRNS